MIYAYYLYKDHDIILMDNACQFVNAYFGYQNFAIGFCDSKTKRFYGALGNPYYENEDCAYIDSLKILNRMYREGLVNEATEMSTYDTMQQRVKKGNVFATLDDYIAEVYNEENAENGKALEPLVPGDAVINNQKNIDMGGKLDRSYIAIGANCEHLNISTLE
mgnify:CR=1 FL=1